MDLDLDKFIPRDWSYHLSSSRSNKVLVTENDLPSNLRYSLREVISSTGHGTKSVSIYRIENPKKYLQYELKKLEMECSSKARFEKFLYHVTGASNLNSICDNNLNHRLVSRAKFGAGVSFTPDVEYGCQHSQYRASRTVVLLCQVLCRFTIQGGYHQWIPEGGNDTTTGNNGQEMQLRSTIEAQKLELLALIKEMKLNDQLKEFITENSNEKSNDDTDNNITSLNNTESDRDKKEQSFEGDVQQWSADTVCEWMKSLNLIDEHISKAKFLSISGKELLQMTLTDIEKEFNIKNVFHRKKLFLAIEALRTKQEYLTKASQLDCNWVLRWLDDIGLPQYKESFSINLIDGRMIHSLTYDDLALLGITSAVHLASLQTSIQVLRENHFEPDIFKRRALPNDPQQPDPPEIALWTTHRVMDWLRSIDLSEYASNLRGSGVHGALIVYEPRFNDNLLASVLTITNDKTLLRRHLGTYFKQLLGSQITIAKREAELNSPPLTLATKIKVCKKSQFTLKRKKRQYDDVDNLICPLDGKNRDENCNSPSTIR